MTRRPTVKAGGGASTHALARTLSGALLLEDLGHTGPATTAELGSAVLPRMETPR